MDNTVIVPVYSNGTEMVELTANQKDPDMSTFLSDANNQIKIKSDYTNYKNTYIILLLFYVIGNSAPYYYFENLRNKDAWPSHGLGGLFRKLFVHALGFYFANSLRKYIASSIDTFKDASDILGSKYGCTYINNPYPNESIKGKQIVIIPLGKINEINNAISLNDQTSVIKTLETIHTEIVSHVNDLSTEKEDFPTKTSKGSWFLFIIVVLFTVVFSNIITLKGYPIYGVTHMYNPFSCFRCTELIGYILGTPTMMKGFGKYINSLLGHTHYGIKSSMYDAYKMRNVPVYDMGFNSNEDIGLWGKYFVGPLNFLWCIVLRFVQIIYIYTSASIFLNPLTALVLCIVGYVSATPMVFVGGSNAIKALNKKIDMFFLRRWLYYFTQGRCYKGNVFGGVVRRLCTLGFDTWVADAIFNNEQLALACENTFGAWWKRAWNTWKCAKEVNLKKGTDNELMFKFEGSVYKIKKSKILNVYNKGIALEEIPRELVKVANIQQNKNIKIPVADENGKIFSLFNVTNNPQVSILTIDTELESGVESFGKWTEGTQKFFKRLESKQKLKRFQFTTEGDDSEDYSSHSTTIKEKIIKWLKYSVQIFTGLGIGDNPWGLSLRSWTDKFNENTPFLKKIIGFSLYYATTILQNLLGIGGYKEGKGTYFGNLLRISIMYFIATSIYSTKSGQLSFGNSLGFSGGMKFLNYVLVGIVLCMLTLTSNTEYGIDLPNMSLILDPTLSFDEGLIWGRSTAKSGDEIKDIGIGIGRGASKIGSDALKRVKGIFARKPTETDDGPGGQARNSTVTGGAQTTYTAPCINSKETNKAFKKVKDAKENIAKKIYDVGRTKFMSFYYDLLVSVKSDRFETIEQIEELKGHFTELKDKLQEPTKNPYGGPFDDDSIYNLTNIYYKVVKLLDDKTLDDPAKKQQKIMCQRFRYEFENLRIETGCYDQAASRTPTNKITRFMKDAPSTELTDLLQKIRIGAENLSSEQINILMKFLKLMNQDVDKISSSNIKDFKLEELSEIFKKIKMTDFLTDLKKFMPIDALVAKIEKLATSENEPEQKIYSKLSKAVNNYTKSTPKSNSKTEDNAIISEQQLLNKAKNNSEQVDAKSATKTSVMEQLRGELEKQKAYFNTNGNSELGKILKALDELEKKKKSKELLENIQTHGKLYVNDTSKERENKLKERENLDVSEKEYKERKEKKKLEKEKEKLEKEKEIKNLTSNFESSKISKNTYDKKLSNINMRGGAGTAPTKPKQLTPTLYNPLNCNDFDGSCCPQDATGFGTVMNEDVYINSLDGTNDPEKKNMNVFKSKICDVNYVKDNMDDGELYCLDGAYFDKDDMGKYITFQYASSSREKVTGATDEPIHADAPPLEQEQEQNPPKNLSRGDGDISRISNTTPADGVPPQDLSLDSFTKYVKPSEPIMKKVKSSNAYLWNTSFVPSIFNGGAGFWGRFNSNSNYIPPSVCSNLLISNMLMSLDATLYDNQKLSSFGGNSDNKATATTTTSDDDAKIKEATNSGESGSADAPSVAKKKIGSIYNLLEHPMRKYYPMVDINPFDINIQLYGQKFSDWTQFFIGSDKNEDKSIYITSTNEGGVITLRDSYLYTLMSDKETDANAESCHKFYCNKPRCFEITKQCSKYPSVLPNKVFVDHKYMKTTCQCSELDGLMPVQQKTDDGKDPKYWMVHFMENKKLNERNKSGCAKKRSPEEIQYVTGMNESSTGLSNLDEQTKQLYGSYQRELKSMEGQLDKIFKDSKASNNNLETKQSELKQEITTNNKKTTEEKGRDLEYYKYKAYLPLIKKYESEKKAEKGDEDNFYSEKYKDLMDEYYKLKNTKVEIPTYEPTKRRLPPTSEIKCKPKNVPTTDNPTVPMAGTVDQQFDPATGQPVYKQGGGSQFTQELSDLFGKWSTNLRNKQNTGHTYYVPIEYMDTTTGQKFEIEDILVDPVHSRIKVEGIGKSIAFTEEKLKEVVEMYMHEMRSEDRKKNALNEEEKMKHTLSFSDYMTYKKTNDTSNFDDHDEVVGTYDTLDEANTIMKNQSGGGKYVNIDGEKVILKIGKNEKYITKTGRLVSVKDYKNKNNYVELMTIDGEPMKIMSKNKEYYLQKDGTLIKCNN